MSNQQKIKYVSHKKHLNNNDNIYKERHQQQVQLLQPQPQQLLLPLVLLQQTLQQVQLRPLHFVIAHVPTVKFNSRIRFAHVIAYWVSLVLCVSTLIVLPAYK